MSAIKKCLISLPSLAILSGVFALSGCSPSSSMIENLSIPDASVSVNNDPNVGGFPGCTGGAAESNHILRIEFEIPPGSTQLDIYRDGQFVYSAILGETYYQDFDLREGSSHRYVCKALINGKYINGFKSITLTTQVINPPSFNGITNTNVTKLSPTSVRINWPPADTTAGVSPNYYLVYANMESSTAASLNQQPDWSLEPKAKIDISVKREAILTGLGDELPYAFGVRACAFSTEPDSVPGIDDICDVNTGHANIYQTAEQLRQ